MLTVNNNLGLHGVCTALELKAGVGQTCFASCLCGPDRLVFAFADILEPFRYLFRLDGYCLREHQRRRCSYSAKSRLCLLGHNPWLFLLGRFCWAVTLGELLFFVRGFCPRHCCAHTPLMFCNCRHIRCGLLSFARCAGAVCMVIALGACWLTQHVSHRPVFQLICYLSNCFSSAHHQS